MQPSIMVTLPEHGGLDRVHTVGMKAGMWLSPSIEEGPREKLRQYVL